MTKKIDTRKFMQMAIDEMMKSVAEPRTDGKANPKVGAVLIAQEGDLLGTAYRGELRQGDHAEYTLLDKKLRDKNVTGSILFATLEPCAEGARKEPKIECAQRIVNARIKEVWIGIEDPDPKVARKGMTFLEGAGVNVEMFDKDLQDFIESENKQFLKEATLRAHAVKEPKTIELSSFERVVESITIDEFSQDALKHYISRSALKMQPDSSEFLALLEQQELIRYEASAGNTPPRSQGDEFRRNDVKPFFKWTSGMTNGDSSVDKFLNKGDRANILSFREYDDNAAHIDMRKGWVENGDGWSITGRNKQGNINKGEQGYHIDVFFQDKDSRTYRQEFLKKGSGKATVLNEPELIEALHGTYRPTGLGILLFGKNPRTRYPQAVLKVEARYGNNDPEIHDFDGALVLIPDKVEEWLQRVLKSKISREQFARTTEYEYPIEVLREAIINALVHRDYEIEGAKCYLNIDEDKIVVKSPGLPVKPIKFADFKEFKAPSLSRNPKMMAVFNTMGYVEERGIGMREMKSLPASYNLPSPEITWEDPYLTLTFPRSQNYLESLIGSVAFNELNEEERAGLIYIRNLKQVTKAQYAKHFGFNEKKAQRHLLRFTKFGVLKLIDRGPAAKYVFIK
ncbi:MAG: ATP-binding protein [Bacteroidota bacterium]